MIRQQCAPKAERNMDTNNSIMAAVFTAFLKCPTKAHLLAIGEPAPTTFLTDIEARLSSRYKSAVRSALRVGTDAAERLDFKDLWSSGQKPSHVLATAKQPPSMLLRRPANREAANLGNQRHLAPLSPFCFHPGTNRTFPTACSCVSVRLRCRRSPAFWLPPEQ